MDPTVRETIEKVVGHRFKDGALLALALTHASVTEDRLTSNERLEFLGDSVLGLIACERVFRRFPDMLEGDMTKIKSMVVSRATCATIARATGLHTLLVLGKGMRHSGEPPTSLAAAVLESVIAAVYLDGGLDAARAFLEPHLDALIEEAALSGHQQNFKSVLQQYAQQNLSTTPLYRVLDEQGPDHAKCFKICVEIGGRQFPSCWGQSKKRAEQMAALNALRELDLIESDAAGMIRFVAKAGAATGGK
ncbi:MAG: ribonuclease III [Phycisphaerae bacterium]|nr:ribonuclease III [Phycisphaerae bacterium]